MNCAYDDDLRVLRHELMSHRIGNASVINYTVLWIFSACSDANFINVLASSSSIRGVNNINPIEVRSKALLETLSPNIRQQITCLTRFEWSLFYNQTDSSSQ